jgi:hypothetical protein
MLIVVVVLGAVGLAVLYFLSKRTPSRYNPTALTEDQIAEASKRVDTQKVPLLVSYASEVHAQASAIEYAKSRGQPAPAAATRPKDPLSIAFTQDEINASMIKWSQQYKTTLDRYITQPLVALEKDQIVVMATVPELGRVVSMYLQPKVDDRGQLRCDTTTVYLGSLPLPDAMFSRYRVQLEQSVLAKLPAWQRGAKLDAGGAANTDARAVVLSRLVLQLFKREPGPAVLFLPLKIEDPSTTVPVRLKDVSVEKGALTITIQPMGPQERAALAEKIREPIQRAAAQTPPRI